MTATRPTLTVDVLEEMKIWAEGQINHHLPEKIDPQFIIEKVQQVTKIIAEQLERTEFSTQAKALRVKTDELVSSFNQSETKDLSILREGLRIAVLRILSRNGNGEIKPTSVQEIYERGLAMLKGIEETSPPDTLKKKLSELALLVAEDPLLANEIEAEKAVRQREFLTVSPEKSDQLLLRIYGEALQRKPLPLDKVVEKFKKMGINFTKALDDSYKIFAARMNSLFQSDKPLTKEEFQKYVRITEEEMALHEIFYEKVRNMYGHQGRLLILPPLNDAVLLSVITQHGNKSLRIPIAAGYDPNEAKEHLVAATSLHESPRLNALHIDPELPENHQIAIQLLIAGQNYLDSERLAQEKNLTRRRPRIVQTIDAESVPREYWGSFVDGYKAGSMEGYKFLDLNSFLLLYLLMKKEGKKLPGNTVAILGNIFGTRTGDTCTFAVNVNRTGQLVLTKIDVKNPIPMTWKQDGIVDGGIIPCVG